MALQALLRSRFRLQASGFVVVGVEPGARHAPPQPRVRIARLAINNTAFRKLRSRFTFQLLVVTPILSTLPLCRLISRAASDSLAFPT